MAKLASSSVRVNIMTSVVFRVLSCLMENLDEEKVMTDECKEKLLEIQYFISRDFR